MQARSLIGIVAVAGLIPSALAEIAYSTAESPTDLNFHGGDIMDDAVLAAGGVLRSVSTVVRASSFLPGAPVISDVTLSIGRDTGDGVPGLDDEQLAQLTLEAVSFSSDEPGIFTIDLSSLNLNVSAGDRIWFAWDYASDFNLSTLITGDPTIGSTSNLFYESGFPVDGNAFYGAMNSSAVGMVVEVVPTPSTLGALAMCGVLGSRRRRS
jgi:hypothetical protein